MTGSELLSNNCGQTETTTTRPNSMQLGSGIHLVLFILLLLIKFLEGRDGSDVTQGHRDHRANRRRVDYFSGVGVHCNFQWGTVEISILCSLGTPMRPRDTPQYGLLQSPVTQVITLLLSMSLILHLRPAGGPKD